MRRGPRVLLVLWLCACVPPVPSGNTPEIGTDPTVGLSDPPLVGVELVTLGLDGFQAHMSPTPLRYRLHNHGEAQRVTVELEEVYFSSPDQMFGMLARPMKHAPQRTELQQGETRLMEWLLPQYHGLSSMVPADEGGVFLVARTETGGVLGALRMPPVKEHASPVGLIVDDAEVASMLESAMARVSSMPTHRHETARLLEGLPRLFWEYEAASAVLLARPWATLASEEREALLVWLGFGGTLVVIAQHSPDGVAQWAPAATDAELVRSSGPIRVGAGKVHFAYADEPNGLVGELRAVLGDPGSTQSTMAEITRPFDLHFVLPSANLLLLAIVAIALIVGPVVHIALRRRQRRGLAWVVVPVTSLALAAGMYIFASAVKGEPNAVEVQHLIQSFPRATRARAVTAFRLQSAEAGLRRVSVAARQPRPSRGMSYYPGAPGGRDLRVALDEQQIVLDRVLMRRFSNHDYGLVSVVEPSTVALRRLPGGGLRLTNSGRNAIHEVYFGDIRGWIPLTEHIEPGATFTSDSLPEPRSSADISAPWDPIEGEQPLEPLLDSFGAAPCEGGLPDPTLPVDRARMEAMVRCQGRDPALANDDLRILARCEPPGLPAVTITPPTDTVHATAYCLWLIEADQLESGVAP